MHAAKSVHAATAEVIQRSKPTHALQGRRRTSTSCRIHTCCDRWRAYTSAARGGSRRAGTWQSRQARTTHRDPTVGPKGRWQQLYSRQHQKSAQHSNRKPKAETPTMRCQRRQSVPKTAARTNVAKACGFGHRSGKGLTSIRQVARLPPPSVRARAACRRTARCTGTTHTRARCT